MSSDGCDQSRCLDVCCSAVLIGLSSTDGGRWPTLSAPLCREDLAWDYGRGQLWQVSRVDDETTSDAQTIKDIALVVTSLADIRRSLAVRDACTNAAVYPRVVFVIFAVKARSPAAVHAATAAASAPEAALAARQTAAHWRVQTLVRTAAPCFFPGEGFKGLLMLWVNGAAVLHGRHLLARLVEIALRLGGLVLLVALHLACNAALALLPSEDAAQAASECSRHGGWLCGGIASRGGRNAE